VSAHARASERGPPRLRVTQHCRRSRR
jgi:hypothetical protein